jgi:hypothetical protein
MLQRFWQDLIGRSTGPMHLRLMIQPTVATVLAILAGLEDARQGRPAFLWAAATDAGHRRELLRHGWKDVRKVFIVAIVLDAVYQLIFERGVHILELLSVATALAIVPYVLVRGPVARIRKRLYRRIGT